MGPCKDLRAKKMRDRLAKNESQSMVDPILKMKNDILHIFDIWTDLYLAKTVYYISREEISTTD